MLSCGLQKNEFGPIEFRFIFGILTTCMFEKKCFKENKMLNEFL